MNTLITNPPPGAPAPPILPPRNGFLLQDRERFHASLRFMSQRAGSTVVEAAGSHSIYVSQPGATTALIEQAAAAVAAPR